MVDVLEMNSTLTQLDLRGNGLRHDVMAQLESLLAGRASMQAGIQVVAVKAALSAQREGVRA